METRSRKMMIKCFLVFFCMLWLVVSRCFSECGFDTGNRVSILSSKSSGLIVYTNYKALSKCSWFLQGDNATSFIQLKISNYNIECLWDRLFVYQGDSIYGTLFGSITGTNSVVMDSSYPIALPLLSDEGGESGSGSGMHTSVAISNELIVTIHSSNALVYFYSDANAEGRGFNISYWFNRCIDDCSGNGVCRSGTCVCNSKWEGPYCQYRTCPNGCYGNGRCDNTLGKCICDERYTGNDCSIEKVNSYWSVIKESSNIISRAGHTVVVWGEYVWAYGGYRYGDDDDISIEFDGSGSNEKLSKDFVRYHILDEYWEEVPVESSWFPENRYSHSAVVYNDSMYIYGGALIGNEDISNELWRFDFLTLTWVQQLPPVHRNQSMNNSIHGNQDNNDVHFTTVDFISSSSAVIVPLPVKYHSATLVEDCMYILFGYSVIKDTLFNYIQQYNFTTREWSIISPGDSSGKVKGRMGHTSVYIRTQDTILVHGGDLGHGPTGELLSYSLDTNEWSSLASSTVPVYFHSTVLLNDGVLLSFGGFTTDNRNKQCFLQDLQVYNMLCDSWSVEDVPGLPVPAERFGHSATIIDSSLSGPSSAAVYIIGGYNGVMYQDMLVLKPQDCAAIEREEECVNETLCMWNGNQCTGVSLLSDLKNASLSCEFDPCSIYRRCSACAAEGSCIWNSTVETCTTRSTDDDGAVLVPDNDCTAVVTNSTAVDCQQLTDCIACQLNSCTWNSTASLCTEYSGDATPITCDIVGSCLQYKSCDQCDGSGCLWCDSTQKCVNDDVYPISFPYGQCLGWSKGSICPEESCSSYNTCDDCHGDPGCGWCRDPSDTGLGVCSEGGYLSSLNQSSCPDAHWFYEQCPLCNCNGHSTCTNRTQCRNCQNMTTGDQCENCISGFYGNPVNGGSCTECNCNGYNPTCNSLYGNCTCLDAGVVGDKCTRCDTIGSYRGNASNFCYYQMAVGFIYTFNVAEDKQKQTFYTAVPRSGNRLNVKFDITQNPNNANIYVQYFIGRVSENYLLLVNLTGPMHLNRTQSISHTFEPFSSSSNFTKLFTFARPVFTSTSNFTELLLSSAPSDYTSDMWKGDIGLVIFVSNQSLLLKYKITIDQNDLLFLAYFFVTFVICFALLLGIFLLGWYIKRKLEIRAFVRAQHVEMQRRVRRPFARVKAVVEKNKPDINAKQNASYVSVETCKDGKAAVLSLLIRLPGNRETATPTVNRTGMGFGSTMVRMNQTSKIKKDKKLRHRRQLRSPSTVVEAEHAT